MVWSDHNFSPGATLLVPRINVGTELVDRPDLASPSEELVDVQHLQIETELVKSHYWVYPEGKWL